MIPPPNNFSLYNLLRERRFFPLFACQFCSALGDNIFRSALIIMATYDQALLTTIDSRLAVSFIGLIFVLPFFLFSSIAGQLADKYEKSRLVKILKTIEVGIVFFAVYGFYQHSFFLMVLSLFLSATQATFFGPLKYSLLPSYLKEHELVAGNGLVEASTFGAILLGSMIGGTVAAFYSSLGFSLSVVMIISMGLSWLASFYLLPAPANDSSVTLNFNLAAETAALIQRSMNDRAIFLIMVGISWFWAVGGVFLAQITTYGREIINGNEHVATLFLVIFALGIALGSIICYRLLKGEIDARLVPLSALGITVFILDLVLTSRSIKVDSGGYIGVVQFLSEERGWRIAIDLFMIAFSGGLYTVPLYALLQVQAGKLECSRIIAVNNIVNAFFMVISSGLSLLLLACGASILSIFLIVGIVNLWVTVRISRLVPESIQQLFLRALLRFCFKVEVRGLEHFKAAGDRVLLIANHVSFIDAILLFAFIPEKLSFAIYTFYVQKWWIRLITDGINLFPVNPSNSMAMKALIEHLKQNRKCVIFPEGRITVTGSLMKIFDGPGMVADKANAVILPIRIDGAQYSIFTRLKGKVRRRLFPKVRITILPPYCLAIPSALKGRERRRVLSSQLYNIMTTTMFETSPYQVPLFQALIEAGKVYGMSREIIEDPTRRNATYRSLLWRSFTLGRYLLPKTLLREYVGIMLPTSVANVSVFFALHSIGRIPVMINFSSGVNTIVEGGQTIKLRMILTSQRFAHAANLGNLLQELARYFNIIYLEDIAREITIFNKMLGLLSSYFPAISYNKLSLPPPSESPAVILFTSGSEGAPKAVALSHSNLNANRYQVSTIIDFSSQDVVFNVMPMFHGFGLTVGTLLPILAGVRTFLYPSPLHYRNIPVIAYNINATIFFATDTFLKHYAQIGHPYDFYAIRYVFAGAEKLRLQTRQMWEQKFGITILEGYGITETSPVLSVNTRMHNKIGTVGRFVPAIQYSLEPVPGLTVGGRLHVKGPNIMQGYINPDNGKVLPTASLYGPGWYDTGDIVNIDNEGFITILGRAKRFAKIGGEMLSLVALEEALAKTWPQDQHVALACPDNRQIEQVVVLTTASLTRSHIQASLQQNGYNELMIPRAIFTVPALPLLGTGKIDLQQAQQIASTQMQLKGNDD